LQRSRVVPGFIAVAPEKQEEQAPPAEEPPSIKRPALSKINLSNVGQEETEEDRRQAKLDLYAETLTCLTPWLFLGAGLVEI
jgi:hypothetical protein